jgi:flagellar hook-associated protein FlgK
MRDFAENATPAAQCDAMLREINRIYQEIETLYQSMMHDMVDAPVDSIKKATDIMNSLFQNAGVMDRLITESLSSMPHLPGSTKDLLDRRDDLLRLLHRTNRTLLNKAENIKALLRHEIVNMTKNQNALKGYKPVETERNSIVRNFF